MTTKTRTYLNFYGIVPKKLPPCASFTLIFNTQSSHFEHTEHICSPIKRVSMVSNGVFLSPCLRLPSILYIQSTAFTTSLIISSVEVRFQQRMPCNHNHYRFSCATTLPPRTTAYNQFLAFGDCSASLWIGTCRCCGEALIFPGCTASWSLGRCWEGLLLQSHSFSCLILRLLSYLMLELALKLYSTQPISSLLLLSLR